MPANVRLFPIEVEPAEEPKDLRNRHTVALRKLGLEYSFGANGQNAAADESIAKAVIQMSPLRPLEADLWDAYLPDHEFNIPGFLHMLDYRRLPSVDYLPVEVIQHFTTAQNLLAFHFFQFRFSIDVPDVLLLGLRKDKVGKVGDSYMLAHWNAKGGPLATLEEVKSWLRAKSSSRALQKLCDTHDQFAVQAA